MQQVYTCPPLVPVSCVTVNQGQHNLTLTLILTQTLILTLTGLIE